MSWNESCKFCPVKLTAKHCRKQNIGFSGKRKKGHVEARRAGKGFFGCAKRCKRFEAKEGGI